MTSFGYGEFALSYILYHSVRVYPRLGGDKIRGLKRYRFLHFARLTDIGTLDLIDDDKVCLANLNRQVPGSNAYVPAVAGLICAGEVINDIALDRV